MLADFNSLEYWGNNREWSNNMGKIMEFNKCVKARGLVELPTLGKQLGW